jgi:hypothetical protein
MGFWSSVGSSVSSVCSAVGGAISSTFGSVSNACTGFLNNITNVLAAVSPVLTALSVAMPQLRVAAAVVDVALTVLGLLQPNETTEELGDHILQAYEADIKPADFSTYDEYVAAIRNFKLDPEKSEKLNVGEKFAAGLSVLAWGMEEKLGTGSSNLLVNILNDVPNLDKGQGYFTEQRVTNILDTVKDVAELCKYFSKKLSPDAENRVEQQLIQAEQALNPDKDIETIYQELDQNRKG